MKQNLVLAIGIVLLIAGCTNQPPHTEDYHAHADLLVVLDGQTFDFNKAEFMSTPYKPLNEFTHLHDFNPNVIHFHAEGINLGEFFQSIGMGIDSSCFDTGDAQFCSGNGKTLFFYVNGKPNTEPGNYVPNDLDKILVFYGENPPSQQVIDSVTSQACIYSEKCALPPGWVLPEESCSISKPCELPT